MPHMIAPPVPWESCSYPDALVEPVALDKTAFDSRATRLPRSEQSIAY